MDTGAFKKKLQQKLSEQQDILKTATDDANAIRLPHCRDGFEVAEEKDRAVIIDTTLRLAQANINYIRIALAKLEKDEYGYCECCEEGISPQRLEISPEASFCLSCMETIDGKAGVG